MRHWSVYSGRHLPNLPATRRQRAALPRCLAVQPDAPNVRPSQVQASSVGSRPLKAGQADKLPIGFAGSRLHGGLLASVAMSIFCYIFPKICLISGVIQPPAFASPSSGSPNHAAGTHCSLMVICGFFFGGECLIKACQYAKLSRRKPKPYAVNPHSCEPIQPHAHKGRAAQLPKQKSFIIQTCSNPLQP